MSVGIIEGMVTDKSYFGVALNKFKSLAISSLNTLTGLTSSQINENGMEQVLVHREQQILACSNFAEFPILIYQTYAMGIYEDKTVYNVNLQEQVHDQLLKLCLVYITAEASASVLNKLPQIPQAPQAPQTIYKPESLIVGLVKTDPVTKKIGRYEFLTKISESDLDDCNCPYCQTRLNFQEMHDKMVKENNSTIAPVGLRGVTKSANDQVIEYLKSVPKNNVIYAGDDKMPDLVEAGLSSTKVVVPIIHKVLLDQIELEMAKPTVTPKAADNFDWNSITRKKQTPPEIDAAFKPTAEEKITLKWPVQINLTTEFMATADKMRAAGKPNQADEIVNLVRFIDKMMNH